MNTFDGSFFFPSRDIVAASHLQPLEKKDKISESKLQQPWNTLATSDNKKQELRLTRDTEEVPRHGGECCTRHRGSKKKGRGEENGRRDMRELVGGEKVIGWTWKEVVEGKESGREVKR